MRRSTDSLGAPPFPCSSRASSWPSSPYPPAIVAAAAKLIESVGANGFSLRKLAKALGVGPTTIHFHFEGGVGSVFCAVAQQALAGVTRPYKLLAECGRSSAADQKEASAQMHKTIAGLVADGVSEFDGIARGPRRRDHSGGVAKPSPAVAAEYADRLIAIPSNSETPATRPQSFCASAPTFWSAALERPHSAELVRPGDARPPPGRPRKRRTQRRLRNGNRQTDLRLGELAQAEPVCADALDQLGGGGDDTQVGMATMMTLAMSGEERDLPANR